MKKSIKLTAVAAAAALTLGTGVTAFADGGRDGRMGGPKGGMHQAGPKGPQFNADGVAAVLAELVKAGTITQAQSDAVSKALVNAPAAAKAAAEAAKAAHEKLIADTIGLPWADIQTRVKAGETLAAIAGDKKDALITALVKEATDRINAELAAGRLTEDQATKMKTGLTERITAHVTSTHGSKGDKRMKGKGLKPKVSATPSSTSATTSAKSKGKAVVKQVVTKKTTKAAKAS